ncbi:hypothetical protein COMNV_00822 [Commensalibacter sp. Nvir]|uniref:nicotinate phosphoribosyltransferase n=1 Tax=Commensalibacter sp. Nvir TaxID=3069817 RepID=UPI002D6FED3B|nr:hypothetical protein COMNV_00822 [Commensalibacter sp. Nvir]
MCFKKEPSLENGFRSALAAKEPHDYIKIEERTDTYFIKTKTIVDHYGDKEVVYAIFLRRPVVSAPRLVLDWLDLIFRREKIKAEVYVAFPEGEWVGAGLPILYIKGSFKQLVMLETIFLQKLGVCCVAACNAYQMALTLPHVQFVAMGARHCAGFEMQEMVEYAAWVGSQAAKKKIGAKGFIGTSSNETSKSFFGLRQGFGTMPHALIGYAGSTLAAAELFHEQFPTQDLSVLVDYFGKEVTDGLAVCRQFSELAHKGKISLRIDTHGGRYLEELNQQTSYELIMRHAPETLQRYCSEKELAYLVGTGVSAASLWHMREKLDAAGFPKVKLIASSGFDFAKCLIMSEAGAPVDCIGTGSYIPNLWNETYATADIIAYDGKPLVKVGREYLIGFAEKQTNIF